MTFVLYVKINGESSSENKYLYDYYSNLKLNGEDSGVDLIIPNDYKLETLSNINQLTINHRISYILIDTKSKQIKPSYLYPRSSISKTNFRLANHVGIIDKGYRGNILAKVDVIPCFKNKPNEIEKGSRLFQICAPDLSPITQLYIVEKLPNSLRMENGFGSTGK